MPLESVLTIILSSTLISAIISALFSIITNRKKDYINNIVRERKTWRDSLRRISNDFSNCYEFSDLKKAINALRVHINPYGIGRDAVTYDAYIWDMIFSIETKDEMSEKEIGNYKTSIINYISCLLKYDWERVKSEINGNTQTKIIIITLFASFLIQISKFIYNGSSFYDYYQFVIYFALVSGFDILMINLSDKWKAPGQLISYMLFLFSGIYVLLSLYFKTFGFPLINEIDFYVFIAPYAALIYGIECRLIIYINNVRRLIITLNIIKKKNEITNGYWPFITRKGYKNNPRVRQYAPCKSTNAQNDNQEISVE